MTGLDKILAQIKADTDSTCADIKRKADERCNDIINSAHAEADVIRKDGEAKGKLNAAEILKRAESAAKLQRRSVMLNSKQEIITTALDKALEHFCSLADNEYFALIYSMISKYSESQDGVIILSSKDLSRLPKNFEARINKKSKGKLTVSESVADIKGGFILKYGGIEVNCALESIFIAENERFSDTVSLVLFSDGGDYE